MSPPFQALVLLQAAVTAGLALLTILYYLRVSREAYLRDWSAAWAMVSLTQVAIIPSVALADGPYVVSGGLFLLQTCVYYVQAPLFFLSGYGLAHPRLSRRFRVVALGAFLILGLAAGLAAVAGAGLPGLGRSDYGVLPRLFLIGPALIYFGIQFARHRYRSSRAGAVVTAVSSILFGLHFMAIGSGLLGFSVYRRQALLAAAVSVVLSLGSLCGITLTLMDEVRKSALRIADIVDSFRAILWESNPELTHFRFIHDAAGNLLGRPAQHWLHPDVPWLEHVAPADRERIAAEMLHCRDTAQAAELEYRVCGADGSEMYVRNHLRRGAFGEWRGVIINDTERRAAAENLRISEYRQQQALDSAGAGLYDWDLETGQIFVSPRHFQLLGYEQDEFQPTAEFFAAALHPDDAGPILKRYPDWLAAGGRQFVRQYRIRTKSGEYIWVESRGQLVVTAGRRRVLGTIADISYQKKAEFALAEATRKAQTADRAKSAFLANMSHEIRTPLSGILGLAAILNELRLEPRAAELVQLIRASGDALSQVLNDILDISKIEAGKLDLHLEPVDLAATLEEARRFFAPAAAERGVELTVVPLAAATRWVVADALRLRQILFNLLSNALKFTEAGAVTIAAQLLSGAQAGQVEISVEDTGIGIPATRLDELFQPFIQVDTSLTRRFGGTGLGLAITQNLTHLMGGRLQAESTEGAGSTFWFTLPAAQAIDVPAPPPAAPSTSTALPGLRVLLAEDNQINQLIARRAIEKTGAHVHLAVDGEQALRAAVEGDFDVILMDVQMPHLDGLEVTRRIRQEMLPRQPYIVALTAHAIAGYRETCLEAGMDHFLTKPLQIDALRAVLSEASQSRAIASFPRSAPN
ncbi:MAG: ATP-binding protein [Acidobacteria bacterium]|nr:ATP-binding protein [Acidobacteriota bacterium]